MFYISHIFILVLVKEKMRKQYKALPAVVHSYATVFAAHRRGSIKYFMLHLKKENLHLL